MRIQTRWAFVVAAFLAALLAPDGVVAQRPPARTLTFTAQGTDSATGHPITIHLVGKSVSKGRQYAGTCSIKPHGGQGKPSRLAGEWQFVQNSATTLAAAPQPAIAGIGTRAGARPPRPGQSGTAAGQVINFTIEPRPDGRYQILLMDTFTDESLEFVYPAGR